MADPAGRAVRNPFPGLRPFRTDEEHLFFGRERQIDRMVDKLAVRRFLAVVGTSGSGKSSLVNCGLRPALHRGYMGSAGADWRMATCRPGHDPIGAMAQALAAEGVLFAKPLGEGISNQELIEATLRMSGLGLVDIVRQARLPKGTNLLLVVDQFEELFRYQGGLASRGPGPDASAFVTLLLEAVAQSALPIHVVLTMRSDYLGDCAQFLGLPEAINEGQYLVPRLSRDEIRAAITGPVTLARAEVSPVLLTRLLNDVGDNPDQLSILQHALNRTWAYWEADGGGQGALDLPHYEAVGGMRTALHRHAEKAFGELADAGTPGMAPAALSARQQLAAKIFRTLTDKGTDARGIRRPTALKDLCAITSASQAEVEAVMAVFRKGSRSFLMPPEGERLGPDTRIDISHESLMRVWRRLNDWADEEATDARQLRRLAESAQLHRQLYGADSDQVDGLLTDRELDIALEWRRRVVPNAAWAAQYGCDHALVEHFIQRSRLVRLAARVDAEIERHWQTRGRFVLIGVVAVLFVLLHIAGAVPLHDWVKAKQEAFYQAHPSISLALVQLLLHLLVGGSALVIYDFVAPRLRLWRATQLRDSVGQQVAAAAEAVAAPLPAATAPVLATAVAGEGASAKARAIDPAQRASRMPRLLAALVDLAVALLGSFLLLLVLDVTDLHKVDDWGMGVTVLLPALIGLISARALSSPRQATLGKRLLGLVVVDRNGQRLGFGRAYLRHVAKCLCYFFSFGVVWLPVLLRPQWRSLPDLVAGTVVLRRPQ